MTDRYANLAPDPVHAAADQISGVQARQIEGSKKAVVIPVDRVDRRANAKVT